MSISNQEKVLLPYNETENINIKSRRDITVESIDFGSKLKLILHKVSPNMKKFKKENRKIKFSKGTLEANSRFI